MIAPVPDQHGKFSSRTGIRLPSADALLLIAAVIVTGLPYVTRLGFYNDDWSYIAAYENSPHKDFRSLIVAATEWARPVMATYDVLLYRLFGAAPVGYHVINLIVIAVSCGLFNAVLRRSGLRTAEAFAVAIVWATLPHASTARFWFASMQVPASLGFAFAAALCEFRSVECGRRWLWRGTALVCVITSGLLYETTLPLLALIPVLAFGHRRLREGGVGKREYAWWSLYPLTVGLLVAMKAMTSPRVEAGSAFSFGTFLLSNVRNIFAAPNEDAVWGFNLWRALQIAFVELGIRLPLHAFESARSLGLDAAAAVTMLVGGVVFARLLWARRELSETKGSRGAMNVAIGCGVFLVGWSVFLASASLQLTATGLGNRTAAAASIGVAFVFVGIVQCITSLLPKAWRHLAFSLAAALVVCSGMLVVFRLAEDWARAWTREQQVLSQIHSRFPQGTAGRALVLDGVCQYVGPATVFEASWDLQSALQATYHDPAIRGEVVTPNLEVRARDLRTTMYGEERLYRYGDVILYRPVSGVVAVVRDATDANQFFNTWDIDRDGGCPPGRIGRGIDVFSQRGDVSYAAGFWDREHAVDGAEWRWMGGLGIVRLRPSVRPMVLSLHARVPHEITHATVTIVLDGQVLDTLRDVRTVEWQYRVSPSAQFRQEGRELRIRTDQTFVPSLIDSTSRDDRRLGLIIDRVAWEPSK
jgi:hypothetical protein